MGEFKWYVVRVISGQEKKIKAYIESELKREGLEENLSQILIPMEKVVQLKNGKKVTKERNYYPGYIMVEANLEGEMVHIIKGVLGVVGFLGAKDNPEPLRLSEINRMLGRVDALNESGDNMEVPFLVGEPVKVVDGPFNGFTGVIEEINEEKKKLKVIVKIFGRRTPLELNYVLLF
ncbi:MAG: transcription termination/antitermination factor NusG, partial [Chitinophagaceae bacterium]